MKKRKISTAEFSVTAGRRLSNKNRPSQGRRKSRVSDWRAWFSRERRDEKLRPLVHFLARVGLTPNLLTVIGVVLTLPVPYWVVQGKTVLAGVWLLVTGLFDTLDGTSARVLHRVKPFGAFLDSTMDRVSEAIVFSGFIYSFSLSHQPKEALLAFSAFAASQWVPYARARAEGLGLECRVGLLPRAGRVLLLAAGLFSGRVVEALALIAVLSTWTAAQRIRRVHCLLR